MAKRAKLRNMSGRGRYWDGLQWSTTGISTTTSAFVLVDSTAQEFMPATVVRIRGQVTVGHWGTSSTSAKGTCVMKIMYVEVNDAGTMTGDHSGIDTHEEDIAIRQLWAYQVTLNQTETATVAEGPFVNVEVDVKSKIKLEPSGKKLLVLLIDADATNHIVVSGYVRALLLHG